MRERDAFVYGHNVRHPVARVEYHPRSFARCVQRKDGLRRKIHRRDIELSEKDLLNKIALTRGREINAAQHERIYTSAACSLFRRGFSGA